MLRKLLAVLTVTSFADAQNATPNANLTVAQVVARVQAVNAATTTFSADFTQEYFARAYNTTKTSTGHAVFATGGNVDLTYSNPPGNRVVSNGRDECTYEAAQKQLYKQSASQMQSSSLAFLSATNLSQRFFFQLVPTGHPNAYMLVGTATAPNAGFAKVILYVDAQTFEVRRVLFVDGQQNRNRFDFTNIQRNVPVKASQFVISAPPGTTFIALPGMTLSAPLTCP